MKVIYFFVIVVVLFTECGRRGILDPQDISPPPKPPPSSNDTIPPMVVSVFPAPNSVDVSADAVINVKFSEPVVVPMSAFSLRDGSGSVKPGALKVTGKVFTFSPQGQLSLGATYTGLFTTDVKDTAGNHLKRPYSWQFTVETSPFLQVVATYPADGDTAAAKDTDIWVKFDEPIDAASVNATTFAVDGPSGNIAGDYFVNIDTVRFVPDSLQWETAYTVTLSGIVGITGASLASPYTFSFAVQAIPRWTNIYGGMGRLAITDDGTVYTTSAGPGHWGVMKFFSDGRIAWFKELPPYAGYGRDIAVYSGNGYDEIYVLTARPYGMGGPGNVTKLDGDGNILWTSQDFSFMPFRIEVSNDGRVFVAQDRLYEFSPNDGSIVHIQDIGSSETKIKGVAAFADFIYVEW